MPSERPGDELEHIREITRKQCIGCGATGASAEEIYHEDYCPEVQPDAE